MLLVHGSLTSGPGSRCATRGRRGSRRAPPPDRHVHVGELLLRLRAPFYELTIFQDGRVLVKGTSDEALARGLVARWIGV